jgi:hypothetical protein
MRVEGYLILLTHRSVSLFADGLAATAYQDELLQDYFRFVHWEIDERTWDDVLEKSTSPLCSDWRGLNN